MINNHHIIPPATIINKNPQHATHNQAQNSLPPHLQPTQNPSPPQKRERDKKLKNKPTKPTKPITATKERTKIERKKK